MLHLENKYILSFCSYYQSKEDTTLRHPVLSESHFYPRIICLASLWLRKDLLSESRRIVKYCLKVDSGPYRRYGSITLCLQEDNFFVDAVSEWFFGLLILDTCSLRRFLKYVWHASMKIMESIPGWCEHTVSLKLWIRNAMIFIVNCCSFRLHHTNSSLYLVLYYSIATSVYRANIVLVFNCILVCFALNTCSMIQKNLFEAIPNLILLFFKFCICCFINIQQDRAHILIG